MACNILYKLILIQEIAKSLLLEERSKLRGVCAFPIPQDMIGHPINILHTCPGCFFDDYLGDEGLGPKHLIHYRPHPVHVLIADLYKDGATIGQ